MLGQGDCKASLNSSIRPKLKKRPKEAGDTAQWWSSHFHGPTGSVRSAKASMSKQAPRLILINFNLPASSIAGYLIYSVGPKDKLHNTQPVCIELRSEAGKVGWCVGPFCPVLLFCWSSWFVWELIGEGVRMMGASWQKRMQVKKEAKLPLPTQPCSLIVGRNFPSLFWCWERQALEMGPPSSTDSSPGPLGLLIAFCREKPGL